MKEKPAASGFLNDENDKVDDKPPQPLMKDAKNVQQYAEYQGKEGKWEAKNTYSAGGNQKWS